MREHDAPQTSRRGFIFTMGGIVTGMTVGFGNERDFFNERDEETIRNTKNVNSFIHNAELIPGYEDLINKGSITAMEIDFYSMQGLPVLGHSESEIVNIPEDSIQLKYLVDQVHENGFVIHGDLKSNDQGVANIVNDILPAGSFLSTPHHNLLDNIEGSPHTLLYTLNSREKQRNFDYRLKNRGRIVNAGISAHHKYLNKQNVKFYQENGLYVLAYPVDRPDVAARLCRDGVNGITSNESKILELLAA